MRRYYNLRTKEDNKPVCARGKVLGMEFNTDSQETEVCVEFDERTEIFPR